MQKYNKQKDCSPIVTHVFQNGLVKGREGSKVRFLGKTLFHNVVNEVPRCGNAISRNTHLMAAMAWQEECNDVATCATQTHDF